MKLKKLIITILLNIIVILSFSSINSYAEVEINVNIDSPAAILMEAKTGRILYEKNAHKQMEPASTTKIMTALITLEHVQNLQEVATVSYDSIYKIEDGYETDILKVGEELTIEELLYALLVKSCNEAANVLAEYVAGSRESFVAMMNTRATELGCQNTNFKNTNGVHEDTHLTTAYDLSLIAKEAMKNETFRKIVSTASHTLPSTNKYSRTDRTLVTTNDLIRKSSKSYYEYAIGIKTGYTSQAKYCIVAGAEKDDVELIAVILGADKTNSEKLGMREEDAKRLFEFVYENFSEKEVLKQNQNVKTIAVKNATNATKQLELVAATGIKTLVTNDKLKVVEQPQIELEEKIYAPIKKGDVIGKTKYTIDGIEYSVDLLAAADVEKSYSTEIILAVAIILLVLYILNRISSKKKKNKKGKKNKSKYVKTIR